MKVHLLLATVILIFFISCSKSKTPIPPGWWKIEKIEILKNNALIKVLDTNVQYWNVYKRDSIEIFERRILQHCLHIQPGRNSIKSIDPQTGRMMNEYFIDIRNGDKLELFSNEKVDENNYKVIYYLDKVEDTAIEVIR